MRKAIIIELSQRLQRLNPPSLPEMSRLVRRHERGRRELLRLDAEDLGLRPPRLVGLGRGGDSAAFEWLQQRLGRRVPPGAELLVVPGALSPFALLSLAFVNPGDTVRVPDPGPSRLRSAALLAGGAVAAAGLGAPAKRARLEFLAPCGAPAGVPDPPAELDAVVRSALDESRILAADLSPLLLDLGTNPDASVIPTLLEHAHGVAVGVGVVTFDALFGASASPFALVVGNSDLLAGVRRLAASLGVACPTPASASIVRALDEVDAAVDAVRDSLRSRRDSAVDGLQRLGFRTTTPTAGLSVFASVPRGYQSLPFARMLVRRAGILVRPGIDFGEGGEGGFALSLATHSETIFRALGRLEELAPRMLRLRRQLTRRQRRRPAAP